jgi:enediyne polyketide synthase
MGCVFPDAHSPEELWQTVLAGRRAFRRLPPDRFPLDLYFDPDRAAADKTYSDQAALISGWTFDPVAFHIPPITVETTDPAHWLALSTAKAALADGGIDLASWDRSRCGVVLGNSLAGEFGRSCHLRHRWPFVERALRRALAAGPELAAEVVEPLVQRFRDQYLGPLPPITEDSLAGTMSNTIAGRICNHFDLGGGGCTVDGACSSSLLAVAAACESLAAGRLDLALAGGVDVSLDPYELIGFAKTQALTADDIRPFDERASGMLPGEGCGVLVLVREADAAARGLRRRAVIRGWGVSTDGRGSMTAPERNGQLRALRQAYELAAVPISTVALIEGHGTGTAVGDRVELGALVELLASDPPASPCRIGSIKGNIGHCKAAAGAAGLIKVALALERGILPPGAGCSRPHALFSQPPVVLQPALAGEPWPNRAPRRAGVSAFGFGGSNAHVVLEQGDPVQQAPAADLGLLGSAQDCELILISAEDRGALRRRVEELAAVAERISRAEMTDLAAFLARTDTLAPLRVAVLARSPWNLAHVLADLSARLRTDRPLAACADPRQGLFAGTPRMGSRQPTCLALFPGQGSQRPPMASQLVRRYPFVRVFYEGLDTALTAEGFAHAAAALRSSALGPPPAGDHPSEQEATATELAQPAIVAASLACLEVLKFHGLTPDLCLGHSLGEVSALSAAGALDARAAVVFAAERGRILAAAGRGSAGGMVMVAAEAARTTKLAARCGGGLEIAGFNAPRQTVIAGPAEEVAALEDLCRRERLACMRLPVAHAFHSRQMASAVKPLRETLRSLPLRTAVKPLISGATGAVVAPEDDLRALLANQVCRPVRFVAAVASARRRRPDLWVEVGPGSALSQLARVNLRSRRDAPILATDAVSGGDTFSQLCAVFARAYVLGWPIDGRSLFSHRFSRPFAIKEPPRRIGNPCEREVAAVAASSPPVHSAKERIGDPFGRPDERAQTLSFLMDWLARRTGYPRAWITPGLGLRDDLNLDSIKAMELLQVLASRRRQRILPAPDWDRLTIGELVDAVVRNAPPDDGDAEREDVMFLLGGVRLDGIEPGGDWVRTFNLLPTAAPLELEPVLLPARPSIVIVQPPGSRHGETIAHELAAAGYRPRIVMGEEALADLERPADLGALVYLLPEASVPDLSQPPEVFSRRLDDRLTRLFSVARWGTSETKGGRAANWRWIVLRPYEPSSPAAADDAGAGLLKSLRLEYPGLLPKWLCLPRSWSPRQWAEIVHMELNRGGGRVRYAYDLAGERTADAAQRLPAGSGERKVHALGPADVVVVTGGAKGITCELALCLAESTGARVALVGRSPRTDPEVEAGCRRFTAAGVLCRYFVGDVTSLQQMTALRDEVVRELGPPTALLHGAAVGHPALFSELSLAAFLHCIRVKALGLYNLLQVFPAGGLKAVHVLSSVLGVTGMARQCDYATANAWLDGAVLELGAANPDLHALALGYSVWRDTGIGKRLGTVDLLAAMGVAPIATRIGRAAYRGALSRRDRGRLVVSGHLLPELEQGLFPAAPANRPRFLDLPLRFVPGLEVVAEAQLNHENDPYLRHHVFEGTPILPAVMGIDAMVAAAMATVGTRELPVVREINFRQPVIVPVATDVVVRVCALAGPGRGRLRSVRVALRCSADGFSTDRFTATCVFGEGPATRPSEFLAPLEPLEQGATQPLAAGDSVLAPIFQGTFFRRIRGVRRLDPGVGCVVDVVLTEDEPYFGPAVRGGVSTPFPRSRDAFLHSLLLVSPPGLPVRIRELRFLEHRPLQSCTCRATLRSSRGAQVVFDIEVFDDRGEAIELLRGVEVATATKRLAVEETRSLPRSRNTTPARLEPDHEPRQESKQGAAAWQR